MCGITGIIGPSHKKAIVKMTDALIHRGPDDYGYYQDDNISLGQRRLSIIGIESGRQPIANEAGTLFLVCNGEIYNSPTLKRALIAAGHTFRTETDVEVILHLYEDEGNDCVKRLQGMFAFAIWDKINRILFLARDHMGQKPLFFYHHNSTFAFASEIKGLLASELISPAIDLDGLWHYVSLRFIPDRYSLFQKIQKLPAATSLVLRDNKLSFQHYWQLSFKNKFPHNEIEITNELDKLLQKTVHSHLLSDVPVGAFLSGGIDSSTIAAMMATKGGIKNLPTFSIGVKELDFNELPYARMVVDHYAMASHESIVEADLINLIPSMIYHLDEPSDPFGVGVYLVSQVASKFVKVVLGGDGGDENFAGYDRFAGNQLVDYYCLLPRWFREKIMGKLINRIPDSFGYKSFAQKAHWFNDMSLFTGGERYAHSMSFLRFTQSEKEHLFTSRTRHQVEDYDSTSKILRFFEADTVDELVDRMLYTDLMTRMPDHLLSIVDRMTMAHSIESRSPLVDRQLVEFAARIPADMKLKGKNLKYILKRVASRYLPSKLIYRKKQGFGFPIAHWMRTDLRGFLQNVANQSRFVALGLFNRGYIKKMIQEHISGKSDHNFRIWIFINLEIWYRLYFESETIDSMRDFIDRNSNI